MTEQAAAPEPASAEPAPPGFFTRLEDKILPRAEADAARITIDVAAAVQAHAGQVFDVAGDVLALLKLVDPADAALASSAAALLPKVLGMAESAAKVAGSVMHPAMHPASQPAA